MGNQKKNMQHNGQWPKEKVHAKGKTTIYKNYTEN
jgi:hypothetical protein